MNAILKKTAISLIACLTMMSCSNELQMLFPEGPQGPQGKSAYEVWVEGVLDGTIDWPDDQTDINNFFLYLKGKDGRDGVDGKSAYDLWKEEVAKGIDDPHNPGSQWDKNKTTLKDFWYYLTGADGKDGSTPKIGENGNWWINGEDTGVPAKGADGQDGYTPYVGENGNWWINGEDTGVPAKGADGQDGLTPYIGNNGNWFIGTTDTGVPARGPQGIPGEKGESGQDGLTPYIGENGNWFIGDTDTGVPAFGKDGADGSDGSNGKDGLSAYELWKAEVANGLADPHNPGKEWPKDKVSTADFWEYLRGANGSDGSDGKSAYEIWKELVDNGDIIWEGGNDVNNFFLYLKGEKGEDGADGLDGKSAYEIWKAMVANGLADPHNPGNMWPKSEDGELDFWRYLAGADGKDGVNGTTPHIGENGNWFIGDTDTGKPARGEKGDPGADGKSAYEIWKDEVAKGIDDPHNPGQEWPKDKTTVGDFFLYLQGADGKDGIDGIDGTKVTISEDGYWVLDGEKTDVKAFGEDGAAGSNGKSAYELWKEEAQTGTLLDPHKTDGSFWPSDKVSVADFWDYLRGNDGSNGLDGLNGKSAYDIWVEQVKEGLKDPHNPNRNWPADEIGLDDFWRYLAGADGITPTIGSDGNWWIGDTNTHVPAAGKDGADGTTPHIGDNGNWWIGDRDTLVPARGQDGTPGTPGTPGADGKDGASAYDLWKQAVEEGLKNPHDPDGGDWPKDKTELDDFWEYLRGDDGQDGEDGKDGGVAKPDPTPGMINVIAQYSVEEIKEYVHWSDGTVKYIVLDENLNPLPNAKITNMPNIGACDYTSDSNGEFVIANKDLNDDVDNSTNPFGTATVNGKESSAKTYVPCRIKIRMRLTGMPRFQTPSPIYSMDVPGMEIPFVVERKVDKTSAWRTIPAGVGDTKCVGFVSEFSTTENNISDEQTKKYDLSEENMMVVFRKIISLKDGSFDAHILELWSQGNVPKEGFGPMKWWGEYKENEMRYVTFTFGGTRAAGCYGEQISLVTSADDQTPVAVRVIPLQPMPLPSEIVVYDLLRGSSDDISSFRPAIKLGTIESQLYDEFLCAQNYTVGSKSTIGGTEYQTYEAQRVDAAEFYANQWCYRVYFSSGQSSWTNPVPLGYSEYFGLSADKASAQNNTSVELLTSGMGVYNFFQYPFANINVVGSYVDGKLSGSATITSSAAEIVTKMPDISVDLDFVHNH